MPDKQTVERAKRDLASGKRPSTAAGEFVREEIEHIRQGKHGARSTKQAIAIGLSEARRAGIPLKAPKRGQTSERTRRSAELAYETGQGLRTPRAPSRKRRLAMSGVLRREPFSAALPAALSRQARRASARRSPLNRSRSAREAARTKGPAARSAAARKAAATRARRS